MRALMKAIAEGDRATQFAIREKFRAHPARAIRSARCAAAAGRLRVIVCLRAWDCPMDASVCAAAELATNASVTTLNLWNGSVGDAGAAALAKALATNTTLQALSLYNNSVGAAGAAALAKALETNTTLQELYLLNNSVGAAGAAALAKALETNTTLQTLYLDYNSVGAAGAAALAKALETNTTLQRLDLYNNSVGAAALKAIEAKLARNRQASYLRSRKSKGEKFLHTVSDLHFLLFLSNLLDMNPEMSVLCSTIIEGKANELDGFQLMINCYAGLE